MLTVLPLRYHNCISALGNGCQGGVVLSKKLARNSDLIGSGPVRYRLKKMSSGENSTAEIAVTIDYAEVPVPNYYYIADFFRVENLESSVLLVFGKLNGKGIELRTKLEVYFPNDMFVRQLWNSSREFHEGVRKQVQEFGLAIPEPSVCELGESGRVQTVQANNVLMSRANLETVPDFYSISPREIGLKAIKKQEISLEPLARIIFVSLPTCLGFLDACDRAAKSLVDKFPLEPEQEVPV